MAPCSESLQWCEALVLPNMNERQGILKKKQRQNIACKLCTKSCTGKFDQDSETSGCNHFAAILVKVCVVSNLSPEFNKKEIRLYR